MIDSNKPADAMTVLVADDDEGSLLVAKAAVEKSGHKCIVAMDGKTAWELHQELRPQVVVSDLMMPGLNGFDLCRAIRAGETSYTYVMLLTSHGAREDVLEGMRAGADDYVTKPLDPFVLHTRLLAARRVTALHGALADALHQAKDSNQRLAAFTGRVSHDLRNPLTSILGYLELGTMEAESGRTGEAAEYLDIVNSGARRMLSMVEELLRFSSIGGGSLSRSRLSLASLVQEVTDDLGPGLREAGAAVECADFDFDADESQLRVALQNLIQNAVAYRRPDVPPVIRVSGQPAGAGVVIRVEDNGKGISTGDRRRVVEPLVRLHREGDPPGTGLGLATCASIAAAHGGRLEISSGASGGTTISIYLR
ncbi:response regulator [Pseudarthrobacter siccitolerans]|uniref:response regulator n=1 Tax=Pseudarthrobacter siccitolerans TaxID=861266 RepID=UPI00128D2A66|nr:response regulator [Pseudarthrobacter siccitolerans]